MMTDHQFETRVRRLEHQIRRNPGSYQTKVLLLALLGNAYMLGVLLVVALLLVGAQVPSVVLKALAVKLIVLPGAFLWLMVKALWIRAEPPVGVEVTRKQAPDLFRLIDRLRQQLGAPRFHHVLVIEELTAAVVQMPRLGLFGWPRNYLLLGLPLLKIMTEQQLTAVLAHEFGHLAHGHGRLGNWIYYQRLRWMQIIDLLACSDSKGGFLFKPVFNWFVPYFTAYSFPLARANEYRADAVAVALSSKQVAAQALTGYEVLARYLNERYWQGIFKQIATTPQPGFLPFTNMNLHTLEPMTAEQTQAWLTEALAVQTDCTDTHPSLADRLQAIGASAELAAPAQGQAADLLLGEALACITAELDTLWQANVSYAWEQQHQKLIQNRQTLAELDQCVMQGEALTVKQAFERFSLTEVQGDDDAALAQLQALYQRAPDDALVCYTLGKRLMEKNDDQGCDLLQRVMAQDDSMALTLCREVRNYHTRLRHGGQAALWQARLSERADTEYQAGQERSKVFASDIFEPHGLPAQALENLRCHLSYIPGVRLAYLVKKQVKHLPDQPCYVLGFSITGRFRLHSCNKEAEVQQQLVRSGAFPNTTCFINIDASNARFAKRMAGVAGSVLIAS